MSDTLPDEVRTSTSGVDLGSYVLVTTAHRGVFGGVLKEDRGDTVVLDDCRCCIYWPQEVHGFLGLAHSGPLKGSRVSPAAPSTTLYAITSVSTMTTEAEAAWREGPWSA